MSSPGPRRHLTPLATYGLDSREKAASAMLQSMIIHEIPAHPGTPYEKLTFLRGQVEAIKARLSLTSQDIDAIIQRNKALKASIRKILKASEAYKVEAVERCVTSTEMTWSDHSGRMRRCVHLLELAAKELDLAVAEVYELLNASPKVLSRYNNLVRAAKRQELREEEARRREEAALKREYGDWCERAGAALAERVTREVVAEQEELVAARVRGELDVRAEWLAMQALAEMEQEALAVGAERAAEAAGPSAGAAAVGPAGVLGPGDLDVSAERRKVAEAQFNVQISSLVDGILEDLEGGSLASSSEYSDLLDGSQLDIDAFQSNVLRSPSSFACWSDDEDGPTASFQSESSVADSGPATPRSPFRFRNALPTTPSSSQPASPYSAATPAPGGFTFRNSLPATPRNVDPFSATI